MRLGRPGAGAMVQLHGQAAAATARVMERLAGVLTVRGSAAQMTALHGRHWRRLAAAAAGRLEVASLELEATLRAQTAAQAELDAMLAALSALTGVEAVLTSPVPALTPPEPADAADADEGASAGGVVLESYASPAVTRAAEGAYELNDLRSRLHGGAAPAVLVDEAALGAKDVLPLPPVAAWPAVAQDGADGSGRPEEVTADEAAEVEAAVIEMVVGAVVDGMVEALESLAEPPLSPPSLPPPRPAPAAGSSFDRLSWSPSPLAAAPLRSTALAPLGASSPLPAGAQSPWGAGWGGGSLLPGLQPPMWPGPSSAMALPLPPPGWPPLPPPPAPWGALGGYMPYPPGATYYGMPSQPSVAAYAAGLPGQPPLTYAAPPSPHPPGAFLPGRPYTAPFLGQPVPSAEPPPPAHPLQSALPRPHAHGSRPASPELSVNNSHEGALSGGSSTLSMGGMLNPRPRRQRKRPDAAPPS